MGFLKGLAFSLLSFLLFLSLGIFGLALTVNSTVLSPRFVTNELDRLEVAPLVAELVHFETEGGEADEGLETALVDTITQLEPLIKEQLGTAIYSVYDYLLGKSQSLDLALILRETLLSSDFAVSLLDELEVSSLALPLISAQLTGQIPPEMESLTEELDDIIAELEPAIKEELAVAADPILDYLVGKRDSFSVTISLEPAKESLKDRLWAALLESPPAELEAIPRAQWPQYFDIFYAGIAAGIPSTIDLDQSLIGDELPQQITSALAETEGILAEAKEYVGYFQLGYYALIGLMLLLIAGIVLISRQVKYITRSLGIIFLTYGAIWYAGIFVCKQFIDRIPLPMNELPPSLQTWIFESINNLATPLEMLSLGLLISGLALLIFSFVYRPR